MIALLLVVALAAPAASKPVAAGQATEYVVEFGSHASPAHIARELQRLQKAGLREIYTISSPLNRNRHIYRVVSRRFATYAEARLALIEARRLLTNSGMRFRGVVLNADRAGTRLIR